ncbi:hypothetical protein [Parasedimentitalea psychrophila]|uniref:Uncharacterized protein n=1 Tax=Parasedimentitalea psychrophila TaxID=2997337 RepID=A0A9Y2P809_9RHOB|nr:hypothetical protein [Parasedimentitalea psychrophila]WIY26400.1 hypothetical protein QPJ95_05660 [Parasedimentitalea psychrophila]
MSGTIAVEIEVSEAPDQISQRCDGLVDLLHFYLQAGEVVSLLRKQISGGEHHQNPALVHSLISVLDDALNQHWSVKASQAINCVENLGGAFLLEAASLKEAVHAA